MKPPTAIHGKYRPGSPAKIPIAATNAAPAMEANDPGRVTPPEAPIGSSLPERIDRGWRPASVPISVAQGSDAVAASAPVLRIRKYSGAPATATTAPAAKANA